ncbi:MAG: GTPase HflX [Xanthomonadaceae bacterium]|nr:GTPase HflX [Xanthomonadaceae bacterium]
MFDRQKKGERAVLVLPHARGGGDAARRAAEFTELAKSAGAEVLGSVSARVEAPNPRFYIGSGKADEVAEMVRALGADLVLVDHLLSPVQERNLEKHLSARVVDRAGLILDIFAQRARSHEGKLEVELAQLKHVATRLVRGWTHLDAQRGGAIGNRGPGETQLETDRRLLAERVKQLTKRLEKVQTQRGQQRRARLRNTVPRVALVGYTNAGKSTLFNTLTAGGVYAANQLFATLDPTVRRLDDLACGPAVIADTVGFIRELPHDLVAAFRGTLAEARDADLLLHVSDAADEEREPLRRVVDLVLEEIGAGDVPQLRVFNKIDLVGAGSGTSADVHGGTQEVGAGVLAGEDQEAAVLGCTPRESSVPAATMQPRIDRDADGRPQAVWLSAATGDGIELLRQALGELLGGERVQSELRLPLTAGRLHARLRAAGAIAGEQVDEHGWCLRIDAPRSVIAPLTGGTGAESELLRGLLAGTSS